MDEEYVLIDDHQRVDANEFWEKYGKPDADPTVLAGLGSKLDVPDRLDMAVAARTAAVHRRSPVCD